MTQKICDRLIILLARNKGNFVTHEEIMQAIPDFLDRMYIAIVINELRNKGYNIETMRNVGYRFTGDAK